MADAPEPAAKRARCNPAAKRKVAMLVAYNGAAYSGLQRNPGVHTVEDALEAALHAAGAISVWPRTHARARARASAYTHTQLHLHLLLHMHT